VAAALGASTNQACFAGKKEKLSSQIKPRNNRVGQTSETVALLERTEIDLVVAVDGLEVYAVTRDDINELICRMRQNQKVLLWESGKIL
jgi:hypothetical protein